jgi:NitT/TauT family transport system substrate-binding protein
LFSLTRKTRVALVGAALAVTLAAAGCAGGGAMAPTSSGGSGGGDGGKTIDIVAGVAATPSSTNLLIGIKKGYFADEGLNVTTAPIATGAGAIAQLVNGQLQIALGGLSGTITAVSQGIPIVFVSGGVIDSNSDGESQYGTLVKKDSGIKSFKDLDGKKVALNSLNCCWDFWTRESVAKDGGDQSSLKMVQLPFAQQVDALKNGQVDAITTQQPFVKQAEMAGFVSLGDPAAIAYDDPKNGNTDYFMAKSFVDANPGVVDKWRKALQKSADYANDHPDEVRAMIVETTKTAKELADAAPVPVYTADLNTDTIQKEADFLVKYKVIKSAPKLDDLVVK